MVDVHKALGTSAIALLVAKGSSHQNTVYCKKGEQPKEEWESLKEAGPNHGLNYVAKEFGQIPYLGKRNDLEKLCEAVEEGKSMLEISKIHPALYVRNYRGLANLQALQQTTPHTHDTCRGIWIWGPPGTGKSTKAHSLCEEESFFIKYQNKWWDGHAGGSHVLLDELDCNFLGHYLKIWADNFACTGEIKGGTVKLTHTTFIVTSNTSIQELWADNPTMATAIQRRFQVERMTKVVDPVLLAQKTLPSMFDPKPLPTMLNANSNHIFERTPSRPRFPTKRKAVITPFVLDTDDDSNSNSSSPETHIVKPQRLRHRL